MKKATSVCVAVLMIASLGAGCRKTDEPEPEAVAHVEKDSATNWAPETAKEPEAHDPHDGHDHTGHNH